ncbi:MAG: N,N-dimethylformamidase, partial [Acidimicrobiia bacterium]|nr:N,N-dimethylformamidase [Acidimicrobiia bacterium]
LESLELTVRVMPTLPQRGAHQALVATWHEGRRQGFALHLGTDGAPALRVGSAEITTGAPLRANRWYELTASYDAASGALALEQEPLATRGPADLVLDQPRRCSGEGPAGALGGGGPLLFAAWWAAGDLPAAHYDGRIENPRIAGLAEWDFSQDIGSSTLHARGDAALAAQTVHCPARAVTGSTWDASVQRWADAPDQYAAVHFHHDDLVDAGWESDARFTVPEGLRSGVYAFRVTGPTGEVDHTPFVVRPPAPDTKAVGERPRVVFLLPTATYLAYANHRMTIEGADFFPNRNRLSREFRYIRDHPEVGLSMYEYHPDRSGVIYSSRRRPVLNLKPGADGWAFSADTVILAFLERGELDFDVLTDEDLHRAGVEGLRPYQVVVTGSHPEYYSTAMLDALEGFLGEGGRLMYLGGNGFYWRVAFSPELDGVMEVRRAEDGTRGWIAEPGEYHHQWGGEYGGLWRRNGRPPNLVAGIGFAAQGFDRAAPYRRLPASFDSRAAWIFDGVEADDVVGDYGVGRGAAGQEIDRFDPTLGSPPHTVVLATSTEHSDEMLRTKEELLATRPVMADPKIRADMVFFETPNGGGVFSVGSIAWYGALPHDGWDNDVARITTNVLTRFADPEPLPAPGD